MLKNCLLSLTFLLINIVAFAGIEVVQDSIGRVEENGRVYTQYLVSPGETIYRLSTTYNTSITELLELNPELEQGLKVGQVIKIPYKGIEAVKNNENKKEVTQPVVSEPTKTVSPQEKKETIQEKKIHLVQPGETLYSLSKRYNVSVAELLKWNGMELKAGQELVVYDIKEVPIAPTEKTAPKEEIVEIKEAPKTAVVVKKETPKPEVKSETTTPKKTIVDESLLPKEHLTEKNTATYNFDPSLKQVLIIPFDPHLYFSDADDEIAQNSRIPRVKVREVFRKRLNALLDPPGYEVIHLLGGQIPDTLTDLNRIYSSVSYNYQQILVSDSYQKKLDQETQNQVKKEDNSVSSWMKKQKDKLAATSNSEAPQKVDKFHGKYFGVKVADPMFFNYFRDKYSIDYYIFINQFEVFTDYENCLDRAAQNYRRYFIAHFSIFDEGGNIIAGNKFKMNYDSNTNDIWRIVGDNMGKIAQRVLEELPKPDEAYSK